MATHVVTAFLRHEGTVLLLRRSEDVGTYQGLWSAVSGHIEDESTDPSTATVDEAATREIREETGLEAAVTRVRRGTPVQVRDETLDREWVVHPQLYDCTSRTVDPNYETTTWEWVSPTEILRRETVPRLWQAYEAVAPTVDSVGDDDTHGAAYLSIRAMEVLRDRAATAAEQGTSVDLPDLARQLRDCRPGMAPITNRINRVMHTADQAHGVTNPITVERAATDAIETAVDADDRAAANAVDHLTDRVVTCSRSGTVTTTLKAASPRVLITESRPGGEGTDTAAELADAGLDVTLAPDATVPGRIQATDTVLVGADAVLPDGAVHNKVGTYPLALAADRVDATTLAVTAADKVAAEGAVSTPSAPATTLDAPPGVTTHNPLFESTPAALIDGIVTEEGVMDTEEVQALADDLAALATWDNPD